MRQYEILCANDAGRAPRKYPELELSRLVEAHGVGGRLKAVGGGIEEAVCRRSEREPGKAVQAGKRGKELMTPGESASSNPICYRFKVWAFLFSPRCPSPFNCINENLAMDDGRNSEVFMHNCCVARMLPREVKLVPE